MRLRKLDINTFLLVGLLLSIGIFTYFISRNEFYYYDADFNLHIGMHLDAIFGSHGFRSPMKLKGGMLQDKILNKMMHNMSAYRRSIPRDYSCYFKNKLQGPNMPDIHSAFADPIAGYVAFVGLKFLKQKWHREVFACAFPDGSLTTSDPIIDDRQSFGFMPQYVLVITCPLPAKYRRRVYFNVTLRRLSSETGVYSNITVCTSGASPDTHYQLAMCTMVKSVDSFIPEWLNFHRFVGVEHVFIYDNENENMTKLPETVKSYTDQGFVTIIPWAHSISRYKTYLEVQIAHENDCIWRHKHDVDWMIKIDVDEYIQPMDQSKPRITDYLKDQSLKNIAALRIQNWFFGHPRYITPRGNSPITRNLWRSEGPTLQNTGHDKNILRPINVHYFKVHDVKLGGDVISANPRKELRMVHYRVDNPRTLRFQLPNFTIKDDSMLRLRNLYQN